MATYQATYNGGASQQGNALAQPLGWFSIGLGLAELFAPRAITNMLGVSEDRAPLVRFMGLRELTSGLGILSGRSQSGWLWSRVAGDAIDLAFLGAALQSPNANRQNVLLSAAAIAGVTALDIRSSSKASDEATDAGESINVRRAVTVNRPASEIYAFWRDFKNLPRFMDNLESVTTEGDSRSHWVAIGPAKTKYEWDAEILTDEPNRRIAWCSVGDSEIENRGSVSFQPVPANPDATEILVELDYIPPAGKIGFVVAKLFRREPQQQVYDDLRRLKQLMETGEITTTEGQPSGPSVTSFLRK